MTVLFTHESDADLLKHSDDPLAFVLEEALEVVMGHGYLLQLRDKGLRVTIETMDEPVSVHI